jgi:hypothetical protein
VEGYAEKRSANRGRETRTGKRIERESEVERWKTIKPDRKDESLEDHNFFKTISREEIE